MTTPSPPSTTNSSTTSTTSLTPNFSPGSDIPALTESLSHLIGTPENATTGGQWILTANGRGLERSFKFKTFRKTWEFMNSVAAQSQVQKHHPEWSNVYNTTFIRWTTHSPQGLSEKDINMARFCNEQAVEFGVVDEAKKNGSDEGTSSDGGGGGGAEGLAGLADRVVVEGGDCCVPKGKK